MCFRPPWKEGKVVCKNPSRGEEGGFVSTPHRERGRVFPTKEVNRRRGKKTGETTIIKGGRGGL